MVLTAESMLKKKINKCEDITIETIPVKHREKRLKKTKPNM